MCSELAFKQPRVADCRFARKYGPAVAPNTGPPYGYLGRTIAAISWVSYSIQIRVKSGQSSMQINTIAAPRNDRHQ